MDAGSLEDDPSTPSLDQNDKADQTQAEHGKDGVAEGLNLNESETFANLSIKGSDEDDIAPEKQDISSSKNNLDGKMSEEDPGIEVGTC